METYTAVTNAVGGSLGLSALVATIPLLTFFVMLLGVKARAHWSALVALAASILVAALGFHMPADLAGLSAVRGGIYGLVICWVILGAIWFYQLTVLSGRFEDLRRVFDRLGGGDLRIQAILIAFCFGGLLEALAGFGAPVAITATMILALGVKPLKAAITVLLALTPHPWHSARLLSRLPPQVKSAARTHTLSQPSLVTRLRSWQCSFPSSCWSSSTA